jgi:hypothetical protein
MMSGRVTRLLVVLGREKVRVGKLVTQAGMLSVRGDPTADGSAVGIALKLAVTRGAVQLIGHQALKSGWSLTNFTATLTIWLENGSLQLLLVNAATYFSGRMLS